MTEIVHFGDLISKNYKKKSYCDFCIEEDSKIINEKIKENLQNVFKNFEEKENLVYFDKEQK